MFPRWNDRRSTFFSSIFSFLSVFRLFDKEVSFLFLDLIVFFNGDLLSIIYSSYYGEETFKRLFVSIYDLDLSTH